MKDRSQNKAILVVDDDQGVVDYLVEMLTDKGYRSRGVCSGLAALECLNGESWDLVISDIEMPGMRGIELLKAIHHQHPDQLVLLITAFGSIDLAVEAVRTGACDFITKPFQIEVLYHAIERAFRERQMRREIVRLRHALPQQDSAELVARSPAMKKVAELATRAASIESTILVTGESGAGKGAVAEFIHRKSSRQKKPFVQVNCAAIPPNLVESELFGVRRGAFTGADESRPGLFEQAQGGTLFLDEIAEMPLESQPKLLQALETGRIRPVGGSGEVPVDVRLIAATNRPLEEELRERRFRPDLYYRLNVIRIDVPPLRKRIEDIEGLVDIFVDRAAQKTGRHIIGVSAEAMRWMFHHPWPGNVRELANILERAIALSDHDTILLEDLCMAGEVEVQRDFLAEALANDLPLEEIERAYIRKVMEATQGNKAKAARILGIDRRTLYRKIED